ncbi:PucR family transcriptional regulator ligand-binding domain-containing protein [Streptococcus thoraltensis]|uniref:PucR family transcriptional regulator n=1 Tax=Streptococcus thoraltensis TaxID=55085 RepID=UPI002A83CD47|nr:PucR family transcriptional regulator ligand-binding domain-containing protein [Streptococcus thoraltensis]MDY4762176.1 PucR family transcriptional regulator ligand-binding domain-containing protein [Streptococcus thoraltensis]
MNLENLLQLRPFEKSNLLTGDIGLHNQIESVMVIEALDIEKWAVRNQMLLTSYVAFQNVDEAAITDFFCKISIIGISGIIIKTKRFIDSVPMSFITLCQNYNIPLVEIPPEISYESIILAIHEPLLNYESFLLRSYYDASKVFSNLINPRHSYEEVVQSFTNFTNLPISLTIAERNFKFQSQDFSKIPNLPYIEYEVLNPFAHHHYFIESYNFEKDNQNSIFHYLHIRNIIDSKRYEFYIQLENNTIDHSLILTIEKFLEILTQKLETEYYRKNEIFLHRNKTISAILFGINRDSYDLQLLLEEVNLYNENHYQVLLLTFPTKMEKNQIQTIKKTISNQDIAHVYYESKNTLVYIFNFKTIADQIVKNNFKQLVPKFDKVHYYLSKTGDYQQIQKLFSTCLKMKQFNDLFFTSYFIDESDLGIFNFLINVPTEHYENMIPDDLRKLFEEKYELFDTLHCFIINHLNYGATATELFLHPKTIRYRINKIEQMLQLDLNNPIQLTNYTIGCILLNLRKEKL